MNLEPSVKSVTFRQSGTCTVGYKSSHVTVFPLVFSSVNLTTYIPRAINFSSLQSHAVIHIVFGVCLQCDARYWLNTYPESRWLMMSTQLAQKSIWNLV